MFFRPLESDGLRKRPVRSSHSLSFSHSLSLFLSLSLQQGYLEYNVAKRERARTREREAFEWLLIRHTLARHNERETPIHNPRLICIFSFSLSLSRTRVFYCSSPPLFLLFLSLVRVYTRAGQKYMRRARWVGAATARCNVIFFNEASSSRFAAAEQCNISPSRAHRGQFDLFSPLYS